MDESQFENIHLSRIELKVLKYFGKHQTANADKIQAKYGDKGILALQTLQKIGFIERTDYNG